MIRTVGRRRLACYHEAGHALARWYFGFDSDWAEVLSVEQVRNGVTLSSRRGQPRQCEGLVSGYDVHFVLASVEITFADEAARLLYAANGLVRAEISIIELMAGMAAETFYRKCSWMTAYLDGGSTDQEEAQRIANAWIADPEAAMTAGYRRARALVGSRRGWTAIRGIAERLVADGRIDGVDIAAISRDAFLGQPDHAAWDSHWPPSLSQLRGGFIPASRFEKAA